MASACIVFPVVGVVIVRFWFINEFGERTNTLGAGTAAAADGAYHSGGDLPLLCLLTVYEVGEGGVAD